MVAQRSGAPLAHGLHDKRRTKQPSGKPMRSIRSFLAAEDGLAVTEYGLLLALVAVAVIAVIKTFSAQLQAIFTTATSSLAAP